MNNWNIDDQEGKKILIELIKELINIGDVKIQNLPSLIKKQSQKKNIIIKNNGKKRNINNYIKIKYGNFYKLLIELNHIFCITDNKKLEISSNYKNESDEYVFL